MIIRTSFALAFLTGPVLGIIAQPHSAINQKDAQGRKQGPWQRTWADSDQIRYAGQFKDDKPVGNFSYFSTAGKLESILAWYPDGKAAHAKHYHPDGKLMAEGRYIGEQKDSTWNYYDVNGALRSTEHWKNGKYHGEQEAYFANGKVAECCVWKDGERNGECQQFFENGQVRTSTTYVNGEANGPMRVLAEDGKPEIEGQYAKDLRSGLWKHYNTDGSILMQTLYEADKVVKEKKENGLFRTFYPDDQLMKEETYKHGKRDGTFTEYHDNGRWMMRPTKVGPDGAEKNDTERVLEGQTKKREGQYKNDLQEGEWKEWDEKGKLIGTTVYKAGVAQ